MSNLSITETDFINKIRTRLTISDPDEALTLMHQRLTKSELAKVKLANELIRTKKELALSRQEIAIYRKEKAIKELWKHRN